MTQDQKETILSKIKKLMALTVERGATPEEAATAAAKAQALLMEHNLTMAEAELHDPETAKESVERHDYEVNFGGKMAAKWMKTLIHVIARHNFAKVVVEPNTRRCWVFGKKSNVEVILYMAESIAAQIQRMCKEQMKLHAYGKAAFYNAFCRGAIYTIGLRLDEQAAKTANNAAVNALVVVNNQALAKVVREYFPKLGKTRHGSLNDAGAYQQGREAGHRVTMNRGVGSGGSGRTRLIGGH